MSQPNPKANFIQTLLLMAVIYLGITFFLRPGGGGAPDTRKVNEIYAQMLELNRQIRDNSIEKELPKLNTAADAALKANTIDATQAERYKLQGAVLVADTRLKAAIQRNELARANLAYMALQGRHRSMQNNPLWVEPVTISGHKDFPRTSVTAQQMYADASARLNNFYKQDLILGFIPGYQMIHVLVEVTGSIPWFSYAFAAFLLAMVVRALIWPLAQRQLMWSRQMTQLQPYVKELQDAYAKKDPSGSFRSSPEFQQKMMGLYKEYGINPAAGCLPALAQMPLFLLVYQCMVHYRFEFLNGTFLWINPGTSAASNGFIAPNLGEMDYILLVIYGISMVVTTLLAPVSDPTNAKQQRIMGVSVAVFFTVMMFFWPLPSAFVLYWIFTNVFSTIQSLRAYRLPLPPLVKVNAPHGAVLPVATPSLNGGMFGSTGSPKSKPKPKRKR